MVRGETVGDDRCDGALTLVSGVNARDLPIGPMEAFVLSRIDGQSSPAEIAIATGLSPAEVDEALNLLLALGAVEQAEGRRSMVAPQTMRSGAHSITLPPTASIPPAAPAEELVDLSLDEQRVLLDLDRRLSVVDHYELLGVDPKADPKAVRAAYYELVRVFHPDRHFGKPLGRFGAPLLRVFGRFTEAYEVLRRQESRAEYDRYLAARQRTLEFDRYFRDSSTEGAPNSAPSSAPSSVPPASGERESRAPSNTSLRASSLPPSDPEARRKALARKLGHSTSPPRPSPSSIPAASASAQAADELKRRYEQRLSQARDEQRTHYVALAKAAESKNDLLAAANALRVACSLAPGDLELAGDLAELERRAAAGLWEAYLERAKYAAVEGRLAEAAESYERAALGHPNASLFERAAFYTLEAQGDLKRAAKLAKQAVALAPNSARCHLTLAQVYAAADLRESALASLERARALEPNQPIIKEWIQRVKRGT